jgi:hypothetical protein
MVAFHKLLECWPTSKFEISYVEVDPKFVKNKDWIGLWITLMFWCSGLRGFFSANEFYGGELARLFVVQMTYASPNEAKFIATT